MTPTGKIAKADLRQSAIAETLIGAAREVCAHARDRPQDGTTNSVRALAD